MPSKSSAPPTFLACKGVADVWISVEEEEAPHYSKEYNPAKKEMSCWIESEAGKNFAIGHRLTTTEYGIQVAVYLDGTRAMRTLVEPSEIDFPFENDSVRISDTEAKRLVFGVVELTDDDKYLQQPFQVETLGEIRVVISRVQSFRCKIATAGTTAVKGFPKIPEIVRIHERAKFGLSHCITTGEVEHVSKLDVYHAVCPEILCTFVFRYRPRAMLQAVGIMPPDPIRLTTPPAVPHPESRPFSSLSTKRERSEEDSDIEEVTEEERILRNSIIWMEARLRAIKQERLAAKRVRKKIKLELEDPPKSHRLEETIDLTDE